VLEIVDSECLIALLDCLLKELPLRNPFLLLFFFFHLHLPNSSIAILFKSAAEKLNPCGFAAAKGFI
jgi:hypothetical protein